MNVELDPALLFEAVSLYVIADAVAGESKNELVLVIVCPAIEVFTTALDALVLLPAASARAIAVPSLFSLTYP
jgi:hypothetical protein